MARASIALDDRHGRRTPTPPLRSKAVATIKCQSRFVVIKPEQKSDPSADSEALLDSDSDLHLDDSDDEEPSHSPEYYRQLAESVDRSEPAVGYAPGTRKQLERMEKLWAAFWAEQINNYGPTSSNGYDRITRGLLFSFLEWLLNRKTGEDGRRCRGTKLLSSLKTYYKQFCLVYEMKRGKKMDPDITSAAREGMETLAQKHGLSKNKRAKMAMDSHDVLEFLQVNLTSTGLAYKLGRHRLQLGLFTLSGFITANRPKATLELRYRHLRVTLLRDPRDGPHRILLEFTYEFTKTYLGMKEANTFPIPEILFDPSLVMSPHVILLGMMFADGAFDVPGLKMAAQLSQLDIPPGCNSLPLPLKLELADVHVLRRSMRTATGYAISPDAGLLYSTVKPWMTRAGEVAGFAGVVRPYNLRYGSGRAFDDEGCMSEALRNVIMQHNDPRTFVRHYLPRRVNVDLQAIVRGLEPQAEVMQASCRMLRSLDRRRPYKLTAEQSKSVNQDPRVLRLERRRDRHRGRPTRQEESRRVERDLRNLKQRLRAKLRRNIRESWDREQAIKDIQHQLAGGSFEDIREQHLGSVERTPEHKRLITALMSLPGATLEEEMQRRNEAINAVAAYCHLEESYRPNQPGGCRLDTVPPAKMDPERETADLIEKILKAAKCMVFANEQNKRPLKCFVCFGDTNKSWHQRVYDFARPGDLSKHFKKYHLTHLEANATIKCEVCNITLGHRKHFQRHALATHGTVS